ncbi:MAG: bifunctional enoyl-CoA hydratase/phosphate acetyltransferase [Pseudomonadota bacterium]
MTNRTFDQIAVGDRATLSRTLTKSDIALFAAVSGDVNPAHLDPTYAEGTMFHEVIAHGMWGGALFSTVLGTQLPGPGTIYVSQSLSFKGPVMVGDTVETEVKVTRKEDRGRVVLACACRNQAGETVIAGEAVVLAPRETVSIEAPERPEAFVHETGDRLKSLVADAQKGPALRTAVVHPISASAIAGAVEAADAALLEPVLVGPRSDIDRAAHEAGLDIARFEIIGAKDARESAARAAKLAGEGAVGALMKGALHTDDYMGAILAKESGLRTGRRASHVYVMDTPAYEKLIFITDAAINIAPDLAAKADIVRNAIHVARAIGVVEPKVAILSAVETVHPKMPSTLDAAALCKMADRGQIKGGLLDGPFAFDNAVSPAAAAAKGLSSPVAGRADVLVAPDLEAGNMIAKQLDYLAGAVAAGVVAGMKVPVILTSRAEGAAARTAASAIAKLVHQAGTAP